MEDASAVAVAPEGLRASARRAGLGRRRGAMALPLPTKCAATLVGHEGAVMCVSFNKDGNYCLSGGQDRSVRLWNPTKGTIIKTYNAHAHVVLDVCTTKDNARMASGQPGPRARSAAARPNVARGRQGEHLWGWGWGALVGVTSILLTAMRCSLQSAETSLSSTGTWRPAESHGNSEATLPRSSPLPAPPAFPPPVLHRTRQN